MWTVLCAILIFSGMILIHELGHYVCARIFDVHVLEFSLGMGPVLYRHTSKKTGIAYAVRLFLIGGFVSMEGEDDGGETDRALCRKPVWQRMIITSAGALMNILLGFVLALVMVLTAENPGTTVVAQFPEGENAPSYQAGLREKDEILKVGSARVHTVSDLAYEIMHQGDKPVTLTVQRGDAVLTLENVVFPTEEEQGVTMGVIDFRVYSAAENQTFFGVIRQAWYQGIASIKMVWESLFDLITGRYGVETVSGPVGVTKVIGEAAQVSFSSLMYLCTLISMNLGVFNLLPVPALDGGRLFFQFIELIRRKPLKPRVEGYIHGAGLVLLLMLTALITLKDVIGLF